MDSGYAQSYNANDGASIFKPGKGKSWCDGISGNGNPFDETFNHNGDIKVQAVISVVFGLTAFLTFCFMRPRWTSLYSARKKQNQKAAQLPPLSDSFFGWIPTVYRVTEEQVLASAGLDAFVFLAFFKLAIKFIAVLLFFSLVVIYPIQTKYGENAYKPGGSDGGDDNNSTELLRVWMKHSDDKKDKDEKTPGDDIFSYLWIYVVFPYLFSIMAMRMIVNETQRIIRIRQKYLAAQSSIAHRTIRLSGIPKYLRSEAKIKETVEALEIGKVEEVMLCRNWQELDDLVDRRQTTLRRLEEAWTTHLGQRNASKQLAAIRSRVESGNADENERLIDGDESNSAFHKSARPQVRLWYGRFNLQTKKVDAIDYYEEQLRQLDEKVKTAREKKYEPTPLAFVTLDSIAATQMATQAILDPEPMSLIAKTAPEPSEVVWRNTYQSRRSRMARAWFITVVIAILTVLWWFILVPIAGLLNIKAIKKVSPGFADELCRHEILASLVQTGLPTLIISLLNVTIPYLYDWLSNLQGMTSQADVEMSIISKNFFFTFFNLFVSFTLFSTAADVFSATETLGKKFENLPQLGRDVATALGKLGPFYMNLIVLQALGLFPFRLLQFGSISMYPVGLMGSKTPRDYADLVRPPIFSYGFSLPQTLFIFLICIVYSVLPSSELVLLFGLIYFLLGSFIYKYQLLYSMEHRQFSTGGAWTIVCNRIVVGLCVFQFAMGGQLVLLGAIRRGLLILPLFIGTIWFGIWYRRTYEPLMRYIALRTLHEHHTESVEHSQIASPDGNIERSASMAGGLDQYAKMVVTKFINPSLISPLEEVWLIRPRTNGESSDANGGIGHVGEDAV